MDRRAFSDPITYADRLRHGDCSTRRLFPQRAGSPVLGVAYIISRHGKPAAAMVPVAVYEAWKRQRQELFNQIREIQQEADLDPDEADRLAADAVAAARA